MNISLIAGFLLLSASGYAQNDDRISTLDFVQVVNENMAEAKFYYEKNWKVLRERAVAQGYIHSYELLETQYTEEAPFHMILITTYANKEQYDLREDHFGELIEARGDVRPLNEKKPGEFRKIIFSKEEVSHWTR